MNILVADRTQILNEGNWNRRMQVEFRSTGNTMDSRAITDLSMRIELESLRDYRRTVGNRTREIVSRLEPQEMQQKVKPARLERVMKEEAVSRSAIGLLEYWGKRTVAGLLLMPPTRHNFVHLNQAGRLRKRWPG